MQSPDDQVDLMSAGDTDTLENRMQSTHRDEHHECGRRVQRNGGGRLHTGLARERLDSAVCGLTQRTHGSPITLSASHPSWTSIWIETPAEVAFAVGLLRQSSA